MNFLPFRGGLQAGAHGDPRSASARSPFPRLREALPESDLVLGVRPEHVRFADAAPCAARSIGVRVSRHDADRDRRRPRYGALKARVARRACRSDRRDMSGSTSGPTRCRSSTRLAAGRSAPRCTREARMAEVALRASPSASARPQAVERSVARPSATASSSCCSGRPAPARRRRCA